MKQYLYAFVMCQSMFCAIPLPVNLWDEKARDKMLLFLPLVGLEMGAIWWGLSRLFDFLALPQLIRGLVLAAYPFLVTGFLHLDGFMDVCDAVGSCRSLERRREILKDSHVGAFAVIGVVLLILSQFAVFASVSDGAEYGALLLVPAVSRCCSALAVTGLIPMSTSQYADRTRNVPRLGVLGGMLLLFLAAGFILWGKWGFVNLGCAAGYALALSKAYRSLEGMNGDISGFCLTIGELCAAAVFALL